MLLQAESGASQFVWCLSNVWPCPALCPAGCYGLRVVHKLAPRGLLRVCCAQHQLQMRCTLPICNSVRAVSCTPSLCQPRPAHTDDATLDLQPPFRRATQAPCMLEDRLHLHTCCNGHALRMALQKTDAADLLISGPHRSHNADTLTSQAGSAELYRHAEDRTASPAANSGCAPRAGLAAVAGALRVCSSLLHPAQLCHDQPSVPPTSLAITRPTAGAPPCASRRGAAAAAAQRTCAASTAQARHAGRTHGL